MNALRSWVFLVAFLIGAAVAACGGNSTRDCTAADIQTANDERTDLFLLQTGISVNSNHQAEKSVWIQTSGSVDAIPPEASALFQTDMQLERKDSPAVAATGVAATTTSYHHPKNNAEASGVKTNAAGDLKVFVTAVFSNMVVVGMCVGFFMFVKDRYPLMYSNNIPVVGAQQKEGDQKNVRLTSILTGRFGWARAAWNVEVRNAIEDCGLDLAMLLEFMDMAMKIMATVGLPMFFVMGPAHCIFGGHRAGEDHLSYFSFGNVVDGSPLYYIHAFIVWMVVYVVKTHIFAAQEKFIKYRMAWLRSLPNPRANTVLVEGIPPEYQCESKLKSFFDQMLGKDKVLSTYIVKLVPDLETLYDTKVAKLRQWEQAMCAVAKAEKAGDADRQVKRDVEKKLYDEVKAFDEKIRTRQSEVWDQCGKQGADGMYPHQCSSGFVYFKEAADVALALSVQIGASLDEWETSIPPEPRCVLWHDLQQGEAQRSALTLLGYMLTAGLYMAYMPIVIGVTQLAVNFHMGPLQPLWAAFAPTMGLQFMVAFLPTFLILIFRFCFTLKDDSFAQQMLQNWYFVFQVVFVILVTAIGSSMEKFLDTLVERPTEIFTLLGTTMPYATHFYMNYLVLQWASHAMVLTRYIPLGKFFLFRTMYDESTAREMAEPEDQDYYGIGSRSCRLNINLCIGVIYGTLSPPINLLTWVEFFVCRITYGYLLPYAESKKPDLGGHFWVQQLRHLFVGCIIYCIVMTGVLLGRGKDNTAGIIAAPSLFYVLYQMTIFNSHYLWEKLPFQELSSVTDTPREKLTERTLYMSKKKDDVGEYRQPFMMDVESPMQREA